MRTITAKHPGPITLDLDLIGDIHITVENRRIAEIELAPVERGDRDAERMIEDIRVEHSRGYLGAFMGGNGKTGMSVAKIRLPLDSSLAARTNGNSLVVSGRLDAAEVKTNDGDIRLDAVGRLEARANGGSVTARAVTHLIEANSNGGAISAHAVADLQAYVTTNGGSVYITAAYGVRVDSHVRRNGGSVRVP